MARSRRPIRLCGNREYEGFGIEQANAFVERLGEGPYRLMYQGKEVYRGKYHGDCRERLEAIVLAKWSLDAEVEKIKREFCSKWGLRRFPESA